MNSKKITNSELKEQLIVALNSVVEKEEVNKEDLTSFTLLMGKLNFKEYDYCKEKYTKWTSEVESFIEKRYNSEDDLSFIIGDTLYSISQDDLVVLGFFKVFVFKGQDEFKSKEDIFTINYEDKKYNCNLMNNEDRKKYKVLFIEDLISLLLGEINTIEEYESMLNLARLLSRESFYCGKLLTESINTNYLFKKDDIDYQDTFMHTKRQTEEVDTGIVIEDRCYLIKDTPESISDMLQSFVDVELITKPDKNEDFYYTSNSEELSVEPFLIKKTGKCSKLGFLKVFYYLVSSCDKDISDFILKRSNLYLNINKEELCDDESMYKILLSLILTLNNTTNDSLPVSYINRFHSIIEEKNMYKRYILMVGYKVATNIKVKDMLAIDNIFNREYIEFLGTLLEESEFNSKSLELINKAKIMINSKMGCLQRSTYDLMEVGYSKNGYEGLFNKLFGEDYAVHTAFVEEFNYDYMHKDKGWSRIVMSLDKVYSKIHSYIALPRKRELLKMMLLAQSSEKENNRNVVLLFITSYLGKLDIARELSSKVKLKSISNRSIMESVAMYKNNINLSKDRLDRVLKDIKDFEPR